MIETVQKALEQHEPDKVVNSRMKRSLVPSYKLFGFVQADLQVLALLEVVDHDYVTNVVVDGVELGDSVNKSRQIINKRGKLEIKIRDTYR